MPLKIQPRDIGGNMCGIAGFTGPGPDAARILARMNGVLAYRGPDDASTFINSDIAFAHRRLAVVDLEGGHQPRVDRINGDVLIYNGEIYGYRDFAKELRRDGMQLQDDSDTEVLFRLIQRDGVRRTVEKIGGMFAFAFHEASTGTLYLARDRFGEKPLYYGTAPGAFVFGSEAIAIRCHPAFSNVGIDPIAAYRYLLFEYLPGTASGWSEIKKLEPGTILTYRNGNVRAAPYWVPPTPGPATTGRVTGESEAAEQLDSLLGNAVRKFIVADVPVGVFLSGGIDSGVIASWAARVAPNTTAFTVRILGDGFDETPYARTVARHLGIRHEVITLGNADLEHAFDALTDRLGEPLGDSSLLPSYLMCRAARSVMTVALGGDGADELLAGYPNFWLQRFAPIMAMPPTCAGRALAAFANLLPGSNAYMNSQFLLKQLSQGLGHSTDHQSFLWMAPFAPRAMEALWKPDMLSKHILDRVMEPVDTLAGSINGRASGIERLMHLFQRTYLPEDILTKTDRASMFNSLEVRAPFLDRNLADFALSLPTSLKLRGRQGKHILRNVALRHLPADIVKRNKHGFALPIGELIRTQFRERVQDMLLSRTNPVADWFQQQEIRRLLDEHQSNRADHGKKLWALAVLYMVADTRPAVMQG